MASTAGDKLERARQLIKENRYDLEAWSHVLHVASGWHVETARETYEQLVSVFHTSGRFWKMYIEQEMKALNYDRVETLFQRCLVKVLNIDLWRLYLTYVKETKSSLPNFKEKMAQAYDFALDKVGLDFQAFSIFSEYIVFLKNAEAVGSYAENQKIVAIRKVYQRGVSTPMQQVEVLWKDYMAFETAINPIIAEKMSMEHLREHNNARRVARELETEIRGLNRNFPSVPTCGSIEERRQVSAWRRYVHWERDNPLRTEDMALWIRRVTFAYEQCLLCLGHHPDVWHEFTLFLQESSLLMTEKGDISSSKLISDDTAQVFERAISGHMKHCLLIYFAFADFEEARLNVAKVHTVYTSLLEVEDIDPTLGYIQYMKFARRAEGIQAARKVFKKAREDKRSRHHVFVAAALMEYYCSKNKEVAFKVFELGLKRFGSNSQYVLSYIEYLSHLNEDNNTRVLFERVLSSGLLDDAGSVQVWNRFLEFECNVGDLSSIVNVEKRRAPLLLRLKEFDGKQTAQLVDRYCFLDLLPCSWSELRSIGYHSRVGSTTSAVAVDSSVAGAASAGVDSGHQGADIVARPDFSQMVPFKPKQVWSAGEHPLPGGSFPLPPSALTLCQMMPPPRCFHGPFVAVDRLIEVLTNAQLSEPVQHEPSQNGAASAYLQFSATLAAGMSGAAVTVRKRLTTGDSDDEGSTQTPPVNDIYRLRQQKRVK